MRGSSSCCVSGWWYKSIKSGRKIVPECFHILFDWPKSKWARKCVQGQVIFHFYESSILGTPSFIFQKPPHKCVFRLYIQKTHIIYGTIRLSETDFYITASHRLKNHPAPFFFQSYFYDNYTMGIFYLKNLWLLYMRVSLFPLIFN